MRQIKSVLIILTVFASALSSCKKNNNNPQTAAVSISLKVNGTVKSSPAPVATYYKSQGAMQLIGVFNGVEGLSLVVNNVKAGTFDVAGGAVLATYSPDTNVQHTYIGSTGSVVITSFTSTTVSGTFQFTGTSLSNTTGVITEGKFNAKLITQ